MTRTSSMCCWRARLHLQSADGSAGGWLFLEPRSHVWQVVLRRASPFSSPRLLHQAGPGFLAGRLGSEVAQCRSHCWTRQAAQTPGRRETGRWGSGSIPLQRGGRDGKAIYNHLCKSLAPSQGGMALRGVEMGSDIFRRSHWLF